MARVIFFLIFLGVIIYPIFEVLSEKKLTFKNIDKNISELIIKSGKFFVYENNLSMYGKFHSLEKIKDGYVGDKVYLVNLEKREKIHSSRVIYKKNVTFFNFFYQNIDYNFTSIKAIYDLKLKTFKGDKFLLLAKSYKAKGKKFFIDKYRDINADYIVFDIRVKE